MRKTFLLFVVLFTIVISVNSQVSPDPFPKKISVTGSAEMEIIPDQIFVNIQLREYQKKGEEKKDLETIKTNFLNACKAAGIADSVVSIVAYTGYNPYWALRKKKKDLDMFASITYQVRFSSSKEMDLLVPNLDDEATQSFEIVRTSHSKITEYRKQLKILAVKAAKDKALYLTEAIGESLGNAIKVEEPKEKQEYEIPRGSNTISNTVSFNVSYRSEGKDDKDADVQFKKMKLRFEVEVVYALR